jgi:hypothetical protein
MTCEFVPPKPKLSGFELAGRTGIESVPAGVYLFTLARRGHPAGVVGHGRIAVGTSSASKNGTTFGFGL